MKAGQIRTDGSVSDTVLCGAVNGTDTDIALATIAPQYRSPYFGTLLQCEVTDGMHRFHANLSRRVEKEAVTATAEHEWQPLYVTAHLDSAADPAYALRSYREPEDAFVYDNTQLRLFKWFPVTQWVEYDAWQTMEQSQRAQLHGTFDIAPGTVLWVKTRENDVITIGSGMSSSLRDTQRISLQPNAWTDFANPYGFYIPFGDIAAATDTAAFAHCELYMWRRKAREGNRYSTPARLYIPDLPGYLDYKGLMCKDSAYTIYNPTNQEIVLRIPPAPAGRSSFSPDAPGKRTPAYREGWNITLQVRTKDRASGATISCAHNPALAKTVYSVLPPSFSSLRAGVVAGKKARISPYCIQGRRENGGWRYRLRFENTGDTVRHVEVDMKCKGRLPADTRIAFIEPGSEAMEGVPSRTVSPDAGRDGVLSFPLAPGREKTRVMLVGSDAYVQRMMQVRAALVRCVPTPFSRVVHMFYTVPAGVNRVSVSIYDYMGRRVWHTRVHDPAVGMNTVAWQPAARGTLTGAGVYVVELRAYDGDGTVTARFRRRINYIP
jgi:hypothetical protein